MTGLAIFDFDGTLVQGDSLLPFCELVAGRTAARRALLSAVRDAVVRHARDRRLGADIRTTVKALLLRRTLAGVGLETAAEAADRLAGWVRWHPPMLDALRRHADRGHRVVVATGALAIYMPRLLRDLPVDHLMATGMGVADGRLTGEIDGGNCVREEKARRVRAYLEAEGPFDGTWGYGNRPSDLPFLALMGHPTVVKTVRRSREGRSRDERKKVAGT